MKPQSEVRFKSDIGVLVVHVLDFTLNCALPVSGPSLASTSAFLPLNGTLGYSWSRYLQEPEVRDVVRNIMHVLGHI